MSDSDYLHFRFGNGCAFKLIFEGSAPTQNEIEKLIQMLTVLKGCYKDEVHKDVEKAYSTSKVFRVSVGEFLDFYIEKIWTLSITTDERDIDSIVHSLSVENYPYTKITTDWHYCGIKAFRKLNHMARCSAVRNAIYRYLDYDNVVHQ